MIGYTFEWASPRLVLLGSFDLAGDRVPEPTNQVRTGSRRKYRIVRAVRVKARIPEPGVTRWKLVCRQTVVHDLISPTLQVDRATNRAEWVGPA